VAPEGGTTRAEIDGALALLTSPQLRSRLAEADDCADLPHAFVHPDFVPDNAIVTPDGETVVIDWAGAGRGPRLPSLGFLLWAAGAVDLRLVETVVTRYARHVRLEPDELARLAGAIALRPLVLDCWTVAAGRMSVAAARRAAAARDDLVAAIADRARGAFTSPTRAPTPAPSGTRTSADVLPVTMRLSQALVAYTIELDNEFEHRMPHRTTRHGSSGRGSNGLAAAAPWLVSAAMWFNCMRYVDDDGITVAELERRAGTGTNLDGMRRWGYVTVEPGDVLLRTPAGKRAQEVWRPLFAEVDERWQARFGPAVDRLRRTLAPLADAGLPDCLPILRYGMVGQPAERTPAGEDGPALPLVTLLSRVTLAVTREFERESDVSLAVSANVLRVLGEQAVRVRDLPGLTGVSREAVDGSVALLAKRRQAVIEPAPDRGRQVRLTPTGQAAHDATLSLLANAERRAGVAELGAELTEVLMPMSGEALWEGLQPYPDGWRSEVRKPSTLPHYPMLLHRGAFPDGS
jgi:hypothetical protein